MAVLLSIFARHGSTSFRPRWSTRIVQVSTVPLVVLLPALCPGAPLGSEGLGVGRRGDGACGKEQGWSWAAGGHRLAHFGVAGRGKARAVAEVNRMRRNRRIQGMKIIWFPPDEAHNRR